MTSLVVPILAAIGVIGALAIILYDRWKEHRPKCNLCGHDNPHDLIYAADGGRCFNWANCKGYVVEEDL
jgi:hypothetical protein